jgi:predicted dehydrogenase
MDKVRIGVIGLGNMGSAHARNLFEGKIGGALLSAVCDIDPARLEWAKKELGCISLFDDHKKLIESNECDAVVIATPHYFHAPIAIDALNSGLNVMSEKPESVSVSHAERMNEAARESGKVFGIMFNQRTNPLFIRAREEVKSGRLGELIRATWIITNWYRTQYYYNTGGWRASWKGEGGGVLLNQAPHNLDILQWIIGMPDSIIAVCDEGSFHDIEVEDNATVLMKYKNGARAQFITTTGEYPGTTDLKLSELSVR